MRIKDAQDIIARTYFERDSKRGLGRTFIWFVEEVGELAKALRKGNKEGLKGEFADVLAWLLSIGEIAGIDVEEAFAEKYGIGCPVCKEVPCVCPLKPFGFEEA